MLSVLWTEGLITILKVIIASFVPNVSPTNDNKFSYDRFEQVTPPNYKAQPYD